MTLFFKFILLTLTLGLVITNISLAQYSGMGAINVRLGNEFLAQQFRQQLIWNGRFSNYATNKKYAFQVTFKDSSKKEVVSKIYSDTTLHKTYLLIVNNDLAKSDPKRERKVYSDQTLSIQRDKDKYAQFPEIIKGTATDSCWMFKALPGAITVYSYLSELESQGYFVSATIVAIQKGDGPIVKFSPENLKDMLEEDLDANIKFKKKEYYLAITIFNKHVAKLQKSQKKGK